MTRDAAAVWMRAGRSAALGVAAAAAVLLGGFILERMRFGATDEDARLKVERAVHERYDRSASTLAALAADANLPRLIRDAEDDKAAAERLFAALGNAINRADVNSGVTVFSATGYPLAWSGRVSRLRQERIDGPAAVFVVADAFGPRIVRVEPVLEHGRPQSRLGTIAAEHLIAEPRGPGVPATLDGLMVPVTLQTRVDLLNRSPFVFAYPASEGTELRIEARLDPASLGDARLAWRARTRAAALGAFAIALLLWAAPLIDARRQTRLAPRLVTATAALSALLILVAFLLHVAFGALLDAPGRQAADLMVGGGLLLGIVALALDAVERWRISALRPRLDRERLQIFVRSFVAFAGAGAIDVALLWSYARFLRLVVFNSPLDVLNFSLQPPQASRLATAFGLILLAAAVTWGAALTIHFAGIASRARRDRYLRAWTIASWIVGVVAGFIVAETISSPAPLAPLACQLVATAGCAFLLARPRGRMRRASQAARLFGLYVALLVPAIAMYPMLHAFAVQVRERRIADSFGRQAAGIRDELQRQLEQALAEIDAMPLLTTPVEAAVATDNNQAYRIWSQTALYTSRQTSAIELYDPAGNPVSRFALKLPEYGPSPVATTACRQNTPWDVVEEAAHILRASKAVCDANRVKVGSIVVRAMLDYRVLPFIASQEPYAESLRPAALTAAEEAVARDVTFVVYGWSRAPSYSSGLAVWDLPNDVFDRLVSARTPFWAVLTRDDDRFRVYFLSDRGGIYALGYPITTTFSHLMNLAELVILAGVLYVLLLTSATVFTAVAGLRPATGRGLLREIRSSFYRKLFIAFVAVAIVPATILAFAARSRLAGQFKANVNDAAVRTATVAQRLIEDYAQRRVEDEKLRRGSEALRSLDDSIMMLVARPIDQDVSLFDRAILQATSERDLFESGLVPTRTPADVYRAIALQRLPTFRGEEHVGGRPYLVAAAPVRAGGSERIVTVPLTLRQRELQQQITDLDRRVWSAFVLFVLLGAGLGYWMAERIADPVNRLSRATRRIAHGDLDARIAATSSDELRRLVEDFNRMADDLKRQRAELERTQRLEAWADMARQVAHDVKNPLTPIQLSAEHARRINIDRGRPLSPVLDECVNAILAQVSLLREISTEFSSFASSPTPHPEPTDVAALVHDVVAPYRTGLADRIALEVRADEGATVSAIDRTLFSRALTNVIENALHAMPGRGRLTIAVARREQPRGVIVTVTDTGVGIDEEAMRRLFEPYFSTKARGTGLGLTIAKRNVELNGGTIAVESRRDVGTTVTITLPGADPGSVRLQPDPSAPLGAADGPH